MIDDGIIDSEDNVNKVTGKIITTLGYEIEGKLDDYIEISPYGLGDVNNDGVIDDTDVSLVQSFIADITTLTDDQKLRADVNKDGNVDIVDANYLQKYIEL